MAATTYNSLQRPTTTSTTTYNTFYNKNYNSLQRFLQQTSTLAVENAQTYTNKESTQCAFSEELIV
jgi:hypothetical protein